MGLKTSHINTAALRFFSGMSQREFAKEIGASKALLAAIEVGKRSITEDTAGKIMRAFNLSSENVQKVNEICEQLSRPRR